MKINASDQHFLFSSPEHNVLSVSYYDRCPASVRVSIWLCVRTYKPDIVGLGLG